MNDTNMKNANLFKNLVDILYFLQFFTLLVMILMSPFGGVSIDNVAVTLDNCTLFDVILVIIIIIGYVIFLRGLYYLRKMARFLLSNKYFSEKISSNLKKSGTHFVLTGIINLFILALLFLKNINQGKMELNIDTNLIFPLFLMIIGMFFVIQSNTLVLAKNIKEENELTV